MKLSDVEALYNITHIDNLESILDKGILSHNKFLELEIDCVPIWDPGVQDTRHAKRVPSGKKLHDYANLYFNPRNAMMSKLRDLNDKICVLVIDKKIIRSEGVVISDMNAAASYARFYKLDEIDNLDKNLIFARYWTHEDEHEQARRKKIVCAEVLVPNLIPARLITGVYVYNRDCLKRAERILSKSGLSVIVETNKDLYF